MFDGLRLAVTTLTVLPVKAGRIDRRTAGTAMSLAPLVGVALGFVLAGVHWLLPANLLGAALTVALGVLLTRGLHLDGLADSVDALGSYRVGEQALEIMKKADIGPFGVAAIVLSLILQTAAVATSTGATIVVAWAAGRLAVSLACHRRIPAARPEGLGALVAGTVPTATVASFAILIAAGATVAVPGRPWAGPATVVAVIVVVIWLLRHAVRRFGGITGDVIGALTEVATTMSLVAMALG